MGFVKLNQIYNCLLARGSGYFASLNWLHGFKCFSMETGAQRNQMLLMVCDWKFSFSDWQKLTLLKWSIYSFYSNFAIELSNKGNYFEKVTDGKLEESQIKILKALFLSWESCFHWFSWLQEEHYNFWPFRLFHLPLTNAKVSLVKMIFIDWWKHFRSTYSNVCEKVRCNLSPLICVYICHWKSRLMVLKLFSVEIIWKHMAGN